ncbi:three component ABC system middle component [Photobacterium angustum]|uniref:three component ABC system middle component n=1 Tax=Photobacterium angustum TaxID=661 RepID=UPI0005DE2960|nr:three component ABC system middle component [Photobacterium angustum]KJF95207.1 hypothetical protein UB39_07575 [Photobacterium angustum]PSW81098.1 hypothetical protein CTN03_08290 [Photobacterium angustum]
MSNAIDHIESFHYNAYLLAPIIEKFYEFSKEREQNILLSYLVLPLILYPESREKIKYANVNSSIYTIFSEQSITYGLDERIKTFSSITNKCLLLLSNEEAIKINDSMSVTYITKKLDSVLSNKDVMRATQRIAVLFNSHEIVEIFRKLGVKKI